LVASLAFGLLTATVFSLFLIPACFVVFGEFGWLKEKEKAATEYVNEPSTPSR